MNPRIKKILDRFNKAIDENDRAAQKEEDRIESRLDNHIQEYGSSQPIK